VSVDILNLRSWVPSRSGELTLQRLTGKLSVSAVNDVSHEPTYMSTLRACCSHLCQWGYVGDRKSAETRGIPIMLRIIRSNYPAMRDPSSQLRKLSQYITLAVKLRLHKSNQITRRCPRLVKDCPATSCDQLSNIYASARAVLQLETLNNFI
jgi:hypothetical protein